MKFGDGSTVKIEGKGSIVFKCKNGEERTLNEVYFIPTLRSNIISLGQLSEVGYRIVLNDNYLWVYESQARLLMKINRSYKRLYKLIIETVKPVCLLSKIEEVSRLWHTRLGNVNFKSLSLMHKNQMVRGFSRCISVQRCLFRLFDVQTRKKTIPYKGKL